MKIALFGKSFTSDFKESIESMLSILYKNDVETYVHSTFADFLKSQHSLHSEPLIVFDNSEDLPEDLDFAFSLGGDGTFLETSSMVRYQEIPIIGINTGRLGFLANISREEIPDAMDDLLRGKYQLEERSLIQLTSSEGEINNINTALNEVTVHKKDVAMISIHTELNGEFLNSYWADGLIISTPTGSTAYSMSVGGPIMLPQSKSFIISPIAPHNLTVRPIVIPDDMKLTLKIHSRSDKYLVAIDSRSYTINSNIELTIEKSPYTMKMVKFPANNFYNTLRNKLMWGLDRRNY